MATNTAASFTNHTGNASAGPFSISFSYLSEDEIDVTVGGVLKTKTTHYTFPSATTISFTSGNHPGNGVAIKFQRDTDVSAKKVDFQDGSVLTETDLDNNSDQILFGLQENLDVINNDILKRDGSQTVTGNLVFEGATDDGNETTLAITDPTGDRTLTVPDITGTIVTTGDTGTVTSAMINNGTIVAGDLASNSVTTAKITDANVTTAKIADNAVTSAKIANATILTADIADGQITQAKLANSNVVNTAQIQDNSVTTAKVADDAITSAKIADNAITSAHIADGTVVAADIGANAVTASELADDAVDTAAIANSAVTNAKLGADAVNGSKIADDSIDSEHYVDGSIDTAHIADSQVTTAKLASNAVTTAKITDANITTAKLADDAVTAAKIADGAITSAHIAANAVTASELADNAVDTAAIAADAITGAKIADDAINSEHYTDGSIDTAHIADAQITTAKIADDAVTAAKVGTFNLADLTNVHTSSPNDGQVLKWINSNSRWEPANDAGAGGATLADADYGEITVSSSGAVFTIDNDVITSAKIADNAVVTAAINADAVTGAKIADDAVGAEHIEVLDAALQFGDNVKAQFGAGNDLDIFHDGTDSKIFNHTGTFKINANDFLFKDKNEGDAFAKFIHDGAVELYYDGSLQCKTASYGLDFADNKRADFGTDSDLIIYHTGSHGYITEGTGNLKISAASGPVQILKGSSEDIAKFTPDGSCELYYDNSKKFETTSAGVAITGTTLTTDNIKITVDNGAFYCGAGDDLKIYHSGSHSHVLHNGTGGLHIDSIGAAVSIRSGDNAGGVHDSVVCNMNAGVELYYDNSKKLETTSTGITVTGSDTTGSIFKGDIRLKKTTDDDTQIKWDVSHTKMELMDNVIAAFGDGNDLQIYHDGSNSYLINTTGFLKIKDESNVRIDTDAFAVNKGDNSEAMIVATANGAVDFYYDNSKKLETFSAGIYVTGKCEAHTTSSDAGDFNRNGNAGTLINIRFQGSQCGKIDVDTNSTSYVTSSDYRLKENQVAISDGITRLKQLKPYKFNWKGIPDKTIDGFFAHEVTPAVPEAITGEKDGTEMQGIDQSKLVPLLTAALQEAITKIETLETKVAALESA